MSFAETVRGSPRRSAHRRDSSVRREPAVRILIGTTVGLATGVLTLFLTELARVSGAVVLVALVAATLLLPTSRELARRVLVSSCLFLGWIPFLWWWHLPVGHAQLLLGLVAGALVGWFAMSPSLDRLRALVPRFRWADGAMVVASAVATWVFAPLLALASPQAALSRFALGWDHSAHYGMASMIAREGVLVSQLPPGPGGAWSYAGYPQGFHAAAATLMEALLPGATTAPGADLVTYARSMTLIVLLSVVTVIAAVCSPPSVRARPLLAFPMALFVVATFVLGPGGNLVQDGFPNFIVAVAMLACIPVLVICLVRPGSPVLLAALGGAALGVAQNWSLLLSMGALAVVGVFLPLRRSRWPSSAPGWVISGLVSIATLAGLASSARLMRGQDSLGNILLVNGAVSAIPLWPLTLTVTSAAVLCLAAGWRVGRPGTLRRDERVRTAWMAMLPLGGALGAGLIAVIQLMDGKGLMYYFWKYAIALQILSAVLAAVAVPHLVRAARSGSAVRHPYMRSMRVVAAMVVSLVVVSIYGAMIGGTPLHPSRGLAARSEAVHRAANPIPDASVIFAALGASPIGGYPPHVLLPFPTPPNMHPMMNAQWYNALTGSWTNRNQHLLERWPASTGGLTDSATVVALYLLRTDPDVLVLVGPDYLDAVRESVQWTGEGDRVVSW